MEIKKFDRQALITQSEDTNKSDSSVNNKTRSSKGIAETQTRFETAKPSLLFQDTIYPTNRSPRSAGGSTSGNNQNGTSTITDGTSNTIQVSEESNSQLPAITDGTSNTIQIGEESSDSTGSPALRGRPRAGTALDVEDQESSSQIPTISDGTSNTIQVGEESNNQQSAITDGTSNTIQIGDQSSDQESTPPPADRESRQSNAQLPTITDGTSNTIQVGEESSDEQSAAEQRDEDISTSTSDPVIPTITDGSSNTILTEEKKEEPPQTENRNRC